MINKKQKFIKCFSKEDSDKLKEQGLKFLFEDNGIYWFTLDKNINFSKSGVDYKITDIINL